MGVYIDMEMPKKRGQYVLYLDVYGDPPAAPPTVYMADCVRYSVFEVPEPHGRLGDLDELHKEAVRRSEKAGTHDIWYNCADRVICALDIKNAPTIIQASGEET